MVNRIVVYFVCVDCQLPGNNGATNLGKNTPLLARK